MLSTDPPAAHLRNRHGEPLGVLVVEDETMVALMLRELLQELGCQITGWATTADEAERLAAATPPDLLLMDIRLKGARDGIAAAEALRRQHTMPVLFVTGMAKETLLARAERLPRAAVLWKPFTLASLRDARWFGFAKSHRPELGGGAQARGGRARLVSRPGRPCAWSARSQARNSSTERV